MRQILVISGKDFFDPLYNKPAMECTNILESLEKKKDINLISVGDGNDGISLDDILYALSKLDKNKETTIIMQCHGVIKSDNFYFVLGDNSYVSSEELFKIISSRCSSPIDLFTPACHGGGIMSDVDKLPVGSVCVALTSKDMVYNGTDYETMTKHIDQLELPITAYNLLQFYMMNFQKNRFNPFIGISGAKKINLDYMLGIVYQDKDKIFSVDRKKLGNLIIRDFSDVEKVVQKINSREKIYALEYGIALSIVLSEMAEIDKSLFGKEEPKKIRR